MRKMVTDLALLQRARVYDLQALTEIYDLYSPGLFRYAMRLVGDEDLAEDCVAETFNRFLNTVKAGKGPDRHLQAYLYRIAHNWITDHYRRQPALALDPEYLSDPLEDPSRSFAEKAEEERVRNALRLLTPEQRQVVVLKYLENWRNQEIAEAVNKPLGAVKALEHRALRALERLLKKDELQ
jgi:RNA polymerase sigma-70 factor (ECF subfamily)